MTASITWVTDSHKVASPTLENGQLQSPPLSLFYKQLYSFPAINPEKWNNVEVHAFLFTTLTQSTINGTEGRITFDKFRLIRLVLTPSACQFLVSVVYDLRAAEQRAVD